MASQNSGIWLGPPVAGRNPLPENMALVRVVRRHRQRLRLSLNALADRTKNSSARTRVSRQMLGYFESDRHPRTEGLVQI